MRPAATMRRRRLLASLGLLAILAPVGLLAPGAALASCVMPPPLADSLNDATTIFVGTVTRTTEMDRWAEVAVEEVWKGPDVAATVMVKGGAGGNTGTSIDRTFKAGVRYLFVPQGDGADGFGDNACSPTTEWTADLQAMRPATVRAPIGGDATQDPEGAGDLISGIVGPVALVAIVSLVLLGIGLLARGRQEA